MSPVILIILAGASLLVVFGAGIALVTSGSRGNVDKRLEQFVGATDVVDVVEEIEADKGDDLADKLDTALSGRGFCAYKIVSPKRM